MASKAERRARKKWKAAVALVETAPPEPVDIQVDVIERPTSQRMSRGIWSFGEKRAPVIDLAPDMIGELYVTKAITLGQHDNARLFQDIVADFQAELGLAGFRSCLAEGHGGYDGGDGNRESIIAYERLKRMLGAVRFLFLRTELDKPAGAKPQDIAALRNALDKMGA